jgi:hypothetical protein
VSAEAVQDFFSWNRKFSHILDRLFGAVSLVQERDFVCGANTVEYINLKGDTGILYSASCSSRGGWMV